MAFTKLMQWLLGLAAFSGLWATLVANAAQPHHFLHKHEFLVLALPIILIGLFGIYAVFIVLYRVFTFNNCEEAAEELNKQIQQARKDLSSKGFSFDKIK
ncbi:Dolichol-phosphate mannosyltransferase subunit 3 [Frankliniella fusca]|uniref:Dolichol-phosphate mannosyltransferase subunit 3 n=1 Tax=Frankliniella fusca TaxID=407009 RepID=A0AAE1LU07_9NEOP|nr:Dolichol-phosphate mannosyltransferase subunit 3 [Frankliniella fusca]